MEVENRLIAKEAHYEGNALQRARALVRNVRSYSFKPIAFDGELLEGNADIAVVSLAIAVRSDRINNRRYLMRFRYAPRFVFFGFNAFLAFFWLYQVKSIWRHVAI